MFYGLLHTSTQSPAKSSTLDHLVKIPKSHHQRKFLQKCLEDPEIPSQKANRLGMVCKHSDVGKLSCHKFKSGVSNLKVQNQNLIRLGLTQENPSIENCYFRQYFLSLELDLSILYDCMLIVIEIMVSNNDKSRCVFSGNVIIWIMVLVAQMIHDFMVMAKKDLFEIRIYTTNLIP